MVKRAEKCPGIAPSIKQLARDAKVSPSTVDADFKLGAREACQADGGYNVASYLKWRRTHRPPGIKAAADFRNGAAPASVEAADDGIDWLRELTKARALREREKLVQEQDKTAKLRGVLVDREQAMGVYLRIIESVKAEILALPVSVAPDMAARFGGKAGEIQKYLSGAVTSILRKIGGAEGKA